MSILPDDGALAVVGFGVPWRMKCRLDHLNVSHISTRLHMEHSKGVWLS